MARGEEADLSSNCFYTLGILLDALTSIASLNSQNNS